MSKRATTQIGVSWSNAQGQFRKYVGYQLGRKGKPQPKCWYLGTDEREAIRRAVELLAEWNRLRKVGAVVWPLTAAGGAQVDTRSSKDDYLDATVLRVGEVCKLYVDDYRRMAAAGQRSWSLVHSTEHRLTWVRKALGVNTPMASLGEREIQAAVLFFVRRPMAGKRKHQRDECKPLAVKTVINIIRQMKAMLVWYSEMDGTTWTKPKRFDKLFRIRVGSMKTAAEREREAREVASGDVATFTVEELTALWAAARDKERLLILLGLNCGFTSGEVSDLRTFEVFIEAEEPYIHRFRGKTGVEARWCLWPETVELLKRHRAEENQDRRWLLTDYGNPLVDVTPRCRRDAINYAWGLLVARSGIERKLGFRFLRKTGADAVKRVGGLEESEMYLAHREPGVNKA